MLVLSLLLSGFSASAYAAVVVRQDACTLSASGGDDAPAFLEATAACATVTIPAGTTLNISSPLGMTGLNGVTINLQGTVKFNDDVAYWSDNAFRYDFQDQYSFWELGGTDVVLTGGGTLDGNGQAWYDAFDEDSTTPRPIILVITGGAGIRVENIAMIDSPEWFNLITDSSDVTFDNLTITASENSHNTDGWNVYRSDTVSILNSVIINGDDCVAFKPNATNVLVSNLDCTGSHGISVGSLGQYAGLYDIVENVTAIDIVMKDAQNGARIKAWAGSDVGSGIVRNITFTNFTMENVDNPIVIDQCYFSEDVCDEYPSNTYIENIYFNGVTGTASGSTVASLMCSPDNRCSNINVNDVTLQAGDGGDAKFECQNVVVAGNSATLFGECAST
ncbi:glycoside hydrolase family 28 protein [Cylindrobasidium torrendii FP15055 ss-10]|uniref:galacturonan 1,4-alpha-galacturonidase n=1 Tax=Cylindrobasidium torrendii FP15055 ss-10 TaxID=1314674 RepID=A0A0D7BH79_9AGAR|nr:glycoside hydrolase family 28 protein [Cylindrobasidium torrendii FP15055 ss-10]